MKERISPVSVLKDLTLDQNANNKTQHFTGGYNMKARCHAVLLVAASVFLLPLTAHSEIKEGSTEVGIFGGYNWFEDHQNLQDRPEFGGRLGYNFTRNFGLEAVVERINSRVDNRSLTDVDEGRYLSPVDDVDLTIYHLDAVYHFIPDGRFNPFAVVGLGGAHYSPEISTGDMAALNVGVGAKYWLAEHIAIRADLRDYMVTEFFQETYHNIGATLGITFAFGGKTTPAPVAAARQEPKPKPTPPPPLVAKKKAVILATEPEVEKKVLLEAAEPKIIILAFEDVNFGFDQATLTPEAKIIMKRNIQILKENPKAEIRVAGYTSAAGTEEYNQKLSERRAEAVRNYLVDDGIVAADRLSTIGYGEDDPASFETAPKNLYSDAAKANMRVLFEIIVR
jgi:OOP family OmpA-OmpF porin